MILLTLYRAARMDFIRHRRIARWTLPLWLYVSVTGVIVYLMLYHIYPHSLLVFSTPITSRISMTDNGNNPEVKHRRHQ